MIMYSPTHILLLQVKANLLIGSTVSNWGIILSNYMTGKRYLHNKLIASYETSRSSGLWGIPDRMYMQPFTTSGYECSMLRKGGYYAGDYLYYMPVIFSTDETLLCRAEAYTLKKELSNGCCRSYYMGESIYF